MLRNILAITGIGFILFGAYSMFVEGKTSNFIFLSGGIVFLFLAYQNHKKTASADCEGSEDAR